MVNISKRPLNREAVEYISELLLTHIVRMDTHKNANKLLRELLSPSERLQVAKRFAAIVMLRNGEDTTTIEHTLALSRATIAKLDESIDRDSYRATLLEIERSTKGDLWMAVEKLVDMASGRKSREHLRSTLRGEGRYRGARFFPKKRRT